MATLPDYGVQSDTLSAAIIAGNVSARAPDGWIELGALLQELECPTITDLRVVQDADEALDDRLAQRRLGIATSLFAALQCKHAPSARHALRVALTCSSWAAKMAMDSTAREHLEIAALMHDIGIIGAPDHILLKPGRLDSDETAVMARTRAMSLDILRHCCRSPEILAIVARLGVWYNGHGGGPSIRGERIPLASRMIAIAEAFDAMASDRVYRPAISQERAVSELFDCAGTQFDPQLVRQFVELRSSHHEELYREVATRWLHALDPELANSYWDFAAVPSVVSARGIEWSAFQMKLLDNMYDAVVFVDAEGRIGRWNHGAERLTGIPDQTICRQKWHPEILSLADEKGRMIPASDCPVYIAVQSGVQSLRRLTVQGRSGRSIPVDCHAIPVIMEDGVLQGAILVLHDASSEISLEQRCQILAEKAARDPMTQVANRAELDRVHSMFVAAYQQQQVPCSLIICDLDHFKRVNDTYGHQVGDEVIKTLGSLLKSACRPGDLVARYGGEEFVMLCADCDNVGATRRAEQIRKALVQIPQPNMNGRSVSASFGVTEIQPGDTPETMLRRADRGLLIAKANGRNQVVQLGAGLNGEVEPVETSAKHARGEDATVRVQQAFVTAVPMKMAVEKMRGFVADHQATILKIDGNHMQLEIVEKSSRLRRLTDRPVSFLLSARFEEQARHKGKADANGSASGALRTRICVIISPRRTRDRRAPDMTQRLQQVLLSLQSYLMAVPEGE